MRSGSKFLDPISKVRQAATWDVSDQMSGFIKNKNFNLISFRNWKTPA